MDGPAIGKAILDGDTGIARVLADSGISVKEAVIPRTYMYQGEEKTALLSPLDFALLNRQTDIVKLFIDYGLVDLNPQYDSPLAAAIFHRNVDVFTYMVEKGARIQADARGINYLFANLAKAWEDAYIPPLEKMKLPVEKHGAYPLYCAVRNNSLPMAGYLLSAGVPVNARNATGNNGTAVLYAAQDNNFEMLKFLVEHGADLTMKDNAGNRPYMEAKRHKNEEMANYIKEREPAEWHSMEAQDKVFESFRAPKAMMEYLKQGSLKLEFPEGARAKWIKFYPYTDVPQIFYHGKKVLSLAEEIDGYQVMLVWEPGSKKIWFIDTEHDIFHAVSTWTKFIKDAGTYVNRALMWEFD